MPSLLEQLNIVDEDYLIAIANKGLVNRAKREIHDVSLALSISDNEIKAVFPDDTAVKITDSLNQFECSCPSRSICRHVLITILKASADGANVTADTGEESTEISDTAFNYLLNYTAEMLIKTFGKSAYNDILFKMTAGGTAEITQNAILSIQLTDSAFTVRFLPNADLEQSVCSCKNKNCRHLLEAILYYVKHKNGKLDFEITESESNVDISILPHVKKLIEEIFKIGLFRLPVGYAEKCGQFGVLCHGAGFAVFERLFQSVEKEIKLYHQKNAAFNKGRLIGNLTEIYRICCTLENGGDIRNAGKFKQKYMELPKICVIGMGASAWYTKSGFCGVTAIFYSPDIKKTATFTSSRPVTSEREAMETIKQIWQTKSSWNLPISLNALSSGELSLIGAKISENGRLSSSETVSASLIQPDIAYTHKELSPLVYEDYGKIKELFSFDTEIPSIIHVILKVEKIENGYFDRITQSYKAKVFDSAGNYLTLTIEYTKITEITILNLEYMAKQNIIPRAMTVSLSLSQETHSAVIFPIAVWNEDNPINLCKDKMYTDEGAYSRFFEEKI